MTAQTPKYRLVYPVDSDKIRQLPDIMRQQAESIETALSEFDYNGADPNEVLSRVASLELITNELTTRMPQAVEYSSSVQSATLTKNQFVILGGLEPTLSNEQLVTYSSQKFTMVYDCVATVCLRVVSKPLYYDWTPDDRAFLELIRNYSGSGTPQSINELARNQFINEDLATCVYSGHFAAGDSVTPTIRTNYDGRYVTQTNVSITIQRTGT